MKGYVVVVLTLLSGCTSRIASTPVRSLPPLPATCHVRFFEIDEAPPDDASLVARAKHKTSGIESECGKEHTRELLRQTACAQGADAVKVVAESYPGEWRHCYGIRANLYKLGAKPLSLTAEEKVKRLAELQSLREKGVVSEEEFTTLREQILRSHTP